MLNKHKIHTTGIDWEHIHGVHVTAHVYHMPKDLDWLIVAITEMSEKQVVASKAKKS